MTQKVADTTASDSRAKSTFGVRAVVLLLIDTTTRLFVPAVGGTVLGLWLDITHNTKPWFTIIGVIGGTIVAFGLIYAQLKSVEASKETNK